MSVNTTTVDSAYVPEDGILELDVQLTNNSNVSITDDVELSVDDEVVDSAEFTVSGGESDNVTLTFDAKGYGGEKELVAYTPYSSDSVTVLISLVHSSVNHRWLVNEGGGDPEDVLGDITLERNDSGVSWIEDSDVAGGYYINGSDSEEYLQTQAHSAFNNTSVSQYAWLRINSDSGWHRFMLLTSVTSGDLRRSGVNTDYVFGNVDESGNPLRVAGDRVDTQSTVDTPYGDWLYFGFSANSNGYDYVIYDREEQLAHVSGDTYNPPNAPHLTYLNYGSQSGDVDLAEAGYNTHRRLSLETLEEIWDETRW